PIFRRRHTLPVTARRVEVERAVGTQTERQPRVHLRPASARHIRAGQFLPGGGQDDEKRGKARERGLHRSEVSGSWVRLAAGAANISPCHRRVQPDGSDRKSTRLNSSHVKRSV